MTLLLPPEDTRTLDQLALELSATLRGEVRRSEPMAPHTTFKVGGPADLFLQPVDNADLQHALRLLHAAGVSVYLIGNGSNLVVSDRGIRGAVIRLAPHFDQITRDGNDLIIGAGTRLNKAIRFATDEGLSGLESTLGIPGTLGGALVMNAGTDIGWIGDLVESVVFFTKDGERVEKSSEQLCYRYRHSALQDGNLIVLEARLRLVPGDRDLIHAKMERLGDKRTSRQPIGARTAGSTFKNPRDIAAGKLLDRSGCKGMTVGGAAVSPIHANFIVATNGATASDILTLARRMHRRVRDTFDRDLELEMELIGDWDGWEETV